MPTIRRKPSSKRSQASRKRRSASASSRRLARRPTPRSRNIMNSKKVPHSCSHRPVQRASATTRTFLGPWRSIRTTSPKDTSTPSIITTKYPNAKIGDALSERRSRQGLFEGAQRCPRRQGGDHDRRRKRPYESERTDHRLADGEVEKLRRRSSLQSSRRRNLLLNRSRRQPKSTGSPSTYSTSIRHPSAQVHEAGGTRGVARTSSASPTERTRPIRNGKTMPA